MLYRLCNNGRAVLLNREFRILKDKLKIKIVQAEGPYTAIIKIDNKIYYKSFVGGEAELERQYIKPGVISVSIVKNDTIKPTWVCDQLYASIDEEVVVVGANTLEYDNLLNELRIENDVYRDRMTELEKEIKELTRRYEEIYSGYQIL